MVLFVSDSGWDVDDYRTSQGGRPVYDFLRKLTEDAYAKVTATLEMLARLGNRLEFPKSRPMGSGLFEVRVSHPEGPFRILYCFRPRRLIMLLHAFVKKTEQTPKKGPGTGKGT